MHARPANPSRIFLFLFELALLLLFLADRAPRAALFVLAVARSVRGVRRSLQAVRVVSAKEARKFLVSGFARQRMFVNFPGSVCRNFLLVITGCFCADLPTREVASAVGSSAVRRAAVDGGGRPEL